MPKYSYSSSEKISKKKNDIEFKFEYVQTKNPKFCGRTTIYLFTTDPMKKFLKKTKKWWEN